MDVRDELTQDQATRLAVTAVAADLEYWARNASVQGRVGLNDLIQILDMIRLASIPNLTDATGRPQPALVTTDISDADTASSRIDRAP